MSSWISLGGYDFVHVQQTIHKTYFMFFSIIQWMFNKQHENCIGKFLTKLLRDLLLIHWSSSCALEGYFLGFFLITISQEAVFNLSWTIWSQSIFRWFFFCQLLEQCLLLMNFLVPETDLQHELATHVVLLACIAEMHRKMLLRV